MVRKESHHIKHSVVHNTVGTAAGSTYLNDELSVFLDGFVRLFLFLADFGFHRHVDVDTQLFAVRQKQHQLRDSLRVYIRSRYKLIHQHIIIETKGKKSTDNS